MSKVLIDRELLERVKTLCEGWFVRGQQPHMSATDYKVWHAIGFGSKAFDSLRTALAAPSGTPAMPVKAYYHEVPNEYGGFNKSVGLEVRKAFADAPLVLESDAMARIAYLEGEIAKRDARIVELESQYQRDVLGLNNEGDPIGGEPAGGYANDNARLRAELSALKAQEPVAHDTKGSRKALGAMNAKLKAKISRLERELAAPAAKPQVVIPELDREGFEDEYSGEYGTPVSVLRLLRDGENYIEKPQHSDRLNSSWWMWKVALSRLNAAPVQQVSVPDGYVLVPKNSTLAMRIVGARDCSALIQPDQAEEVWHAMLGAVLVPAEYAFPAPAAPAADAGLVYDKELHEAWTDRLIDLTKSYREAADGGEVRDAFRAIKAHIEVQPMSMAMLTDEARVGVALRRKEIDRLKHQLRAELSALKAQDTVGEVVGWYRLDRPYEMTSYPSVCATWHKLGAPVAPLYAAHAQQVIVPDGWKLVPVEPTPEMVCAAEEAHMPFGDMDIALRMAILSAPSAPATVQGVNQQLLEALEELMYAHTDKAEALATAAIAAARKGEGK